MISPKAQIDPCAKLGPNVEVGPWTVIGPNVEIGEGTRIAAHVVIEGPTSIGQHNQIFSFSAVGGAPQDIEYQGEPTRLEIGDNNMIREYCTISRGTVNGGGVTKIGDRNNMMSYSHIAHDCQIANNTIFSNYAALAGHVTIDDYVIISAYSAVHQFCHIGKHAFIAKATYITKDVLPFIMVAGYSPETYGLNSTGLKRRGFTSHDVDVLKKAYKIIFRQGLTKAQALDMLEPLAIEYDFVRYMKTAFELSTRGIVR